MQANGFPSRRARRAIEEFRSSLGDFSRLQVIVILGLVAMTALGGVVAYVRARPREVKVKKSAAVGASTSRRTVSVHVAGSVARPGLYDVKEGSRVADAIAAAGGASPDAMLDGVNLAARVRDGEKVMVPRAGSTPQGAGGVDPVGGAAPVDINTAGIAELDTLPGVGPALAKRIVDYRERKGPFSSVDELDNVEGIGPGKMENLKGLVTI